MTRDRLRARLRRLENGAGADVERLSDRALLLIAAGGDTREADRLRDLPADELDAVLWRIARSE